MDLVGFQNETYAIVGWSERLLEDTVESTGPVPEPQLQLDATVWYTDKIGSQQYEMFYGSSFFDEVATGVARISDEEYALCVHKSPNWERHVEFGDELQVYLLTASGSITWVYNHPGEEGSYAPVDIWYSSTHDALYVLANKLYGEYGFGNQTISLLKLDLQGNLIWEQEHVAFKHNRISATEIVEYHGSYIMTVANNTNGNFPEFIRFNSGVTPGSDSHPFPAAQNVFFIRH